MFELSSLLGKIEIIFPKNFLGPLQEFNSDTMKTKNHRCNLWFFVLWRWPELNRHPVSSLQTIYKLSPLRQCLILCLTSVSESLYTHESHV